MNTRRLTCFVLSFAATSSAIGNPWLPVASLPIGRNGGPGAAIAGDNKIYVLGGHTGSAFVANVQVFDGVGWSQVAPLPTPRRSSAGVDGSGRVYAIGGANDSLVFTDTLRFDPQANAWNTLAPLPAPRDLAVTCTDSYGRIYLIGGQNPSPAYTSTFRYDSTTDSWATLASMNSPRTAFSAYCAPNGMIYAFGGANHLGQELASIERYNPLNNTWTVLPATLSDARQAPGCAGPDGKFYIVGGWSPGYSNLVEVFDPKSETITTYTSLDRSSNNHSCVVRGNYIYAIGGDFGSTIVSRTMRPVFLCTTGDADGDQSVNFQDITAVLSNFNASCP